jgi:hypothetical protein
MMLREKPKQAHRVRSKKPNCNGLVKEGDESDGNGPGAAAYDGRPSIANYGVPFSHLILRVDATARVIHGWILCSEKLGYLKLREYLIG